MGRRVGYAARFRKIEGGKQFCNLCDELISKSHQKLVARFADHIYCDCKRATAKQRRAVAQHHRTQRITTRQSEERADAVHQAQLAAIRAVEKGGSNSAVAIASGPAASTILASAGLPLGSELDSKSTEKGIDTYMDQCDQARADKICFLIMTFVAGCGLPFRITELRGVRL